MLPSYLRLWPSLPLLLAPHLSVSAHPEPTVLRGVLKSMRQRQPYKAANRPARLNGITIGWLAGWMLGRGRKQPFHLFLDLKEASRAPRGTLAYGRLVCRMVRVSALSRDRQHRSPSNPLLILPLKMSHNHLFVFLTCCHFSKLCKLVSLPASSRSKSTKIRRHSQHDRLQPAWTAASYPSWRHPRACDGNRETHWHAGEPWSTYPPYAPFKLYTGTTASVA